MKHAWTEHLSMADKGRARVEVASKNDDRGFQGGQRWPCFEFPTAEGSTGHVASMWLQSQSWSLLYVFWPQLKAFLEFLCDSFHLYSLCRPCT